MKYDPEDEQVGVVTIRRVRVGLRAFRLDRGARDLLRARGPAAARPPSPRGRDPRLHGRAEARGRRRARAGLRSRTSGVLPARLVRSVAARGRRLGHPKAGCPGRGPARLGLRPRRVPGAPGRGDGCRSSRPAATGRHLRPTGRGALVPGPGTLHVPRRRAGRSQHRREPALSSRTPGQRSYLEGRRRRVSAVPHGRRAGRSGATHRRRYVAGFLGCRAFVVAVWPARPWRGRMLRVAEHP